MEAPADVTWTGYSLAERDRRWNAVRANAAQAGFDCAFVPLCVDGRNLHPSLEQARGTRSDGRYLTQLKGAVQSSCIVLPTDGREPVVISEYGSNDWVPNPHKVGRAYAEPMAQMLLDAGMERGRIGVAGLKGGVFSHVRANDGVVNETSFAHVMERLPNATFENGVGAMIAVKILIRPASSRTGAGPVAAYGGP